MAFDRQYGKVVLSCDGCGDVIETGQSNINAAKLVWETEDWRVVCVRRETPFKPAEFSHYCKNCKE